MKGAIRMVVFSLDEARYAVFLSAVDQVVRAVDIAPLPGAPAIVLGVVNVRGRVVPVVNVRARFRLPAREIVLSDQMVLATTAKRPVAFVADAVQGLVDCAPQEIADPNAVVPGLEHVAGIVKMPDGLVLIHDLDRFLALDEEAALQEAMRDA